MCRCGLPRLPARWGGPARHRAVRLTGADLTDVDLAGAKLSACKVSQQQLDAALHADVAAND
jgi:uncharacterized protein YjbI with pentapeptide repeats